MAWKFVNSSNGGSASAPPLIEYTAGSGGVTQGDPLVFSANTVIVKTGATDTVPVIGIAMNTAIATAKVLVCPATDDTIFDIPYGAGTAAIGARVGLRATTLDLDFANVTQIMVRVLEAVNGNSTTHYKCKVVAPI
jgi:hypothetical protein